MIAVSRSFSSTPAEGSRRWRAGRVVLPKSMSASVAAERTSMESSSSFAKRSWMGSWACAGSVVPAATRSIRTTAAVFI
jgi:hypothetical protein